MKKNVWLEATHLVSKRGQNKTGVGYYTANIIESVISLDKTNNYSIFANLFVTSKVKLPFSRKLFRLSRAIPGKFWNQMIKKHLMPPMEYVFRSRPDVVVFFNFVKLPTLRTTKVITVVHDLAFVHYPEFVDRKNQKYLSAFVGPSLEESDHVVAVSEATKRDVIKTFAIQSERISVVPNAVDHNKFKRVETSKEIAHHYQLPERYILFVGTIEPRKDLPTLIEAHKMLPIDIRKNYPLVIAGMNGWVEELNDEVARYCQTGEAILTGYIDGDDLPEIYSGASLFVLPSVFEGFGIPLLEAMACGVPVIGADNSSIPEVVGSAGLLFQTGNKADLADKMKKILMSKSIANSLIDKGYAQSKKYTWENSAKELIKVINRLPNL